MINGLVLGINGRVMKRMVLTDFDDNDDNKNIVFLKENGEFETDGYRYTCADIHKVKINLKPVSVTVKEHKKIRISCVP